MMATGPVRRWVPAQRATRCSARRTARTAARRAAARLLASSATRSHRATGRSARQIALSAWISPTPIQTLGPAKFWVPGRQSPLSGCVRLAPRMVWIVGTHNAVPTLALSASCGTTSGLSASRTAPQAWIPPSLGATWSGAAAPWVRERLHRSRPEKSLFGQAGLTTIAPRRMKIVPSANAVRILATSVTARRVAKRSARSTARKVRTFSTTTAFHSRARRRDPACSDRRGFLLTEMSATGWQPHAGRTTEAA
mmetsp:Transcript_96910/g.202492  ORF Transcript_96910/g.202492 Transcript_96910/m.202492 type:complete len:253 (+) Transcript_96910:871-1629(+)